MQTPASDALVDRLAITPLVAESLNAVAAGTFGTEKVITAKPRSVCAVITPTVCPAAHTLDIVVQGRDTAAGAWVDLASFAQVTNTNTGVQRISVPQKNRYRIKRTAAGAFGANVLITYVVHLVGTDVTVAPVVQVD